MSEETFNELYKRVKDVIIKHFGFNSNLIDDYVAEQLEENILKYY